MARPSVPWALTVNKLENLHHTSCLHISLQISCWADFKEIFPNNIFLCITLNLHYSSTLASGVKGWTKLTISYIRKLSCKHWLFPTKFSDSFYTSHPFQLLFISQQREHEPLFKETSIPFHQRYFAESMVEIGPIVLEKKLKMSKFYTSLTHSCHKKLDQINSLELMAQVG